MGNLMETLETSEKMICKVMNEINDKNTLDASYLELLGEATDALKDIYTIKEKMEDDRSYERYTPIYMNNGYNRRSMGRYMDDNYGHSREEEKEYLRWKMQNAMNEQERDMYRRRLEQM